VAASAVGRLSIPRRCIILAPSHTTSTMRWSLMPNGAYRTPLGEVPVDESLSGVLLESCPFLEADAWAQRGEHAIEAVLPLLQFIRQGDLSILPIVTSSDTEEEFLALGQALANLVAAQEEDVLLIATSDLSHYEDARTAAAKDQALIDAILSLDGLGLMRTIRGGFATMCGAGPVASVLMAASHLGARRAELASYATSLESGGDPHSVVGYGGFIIHG
jgi:AmmeMemoRadiSam system protein B